jgi:hypothetical protein
MEGSGLAAKLRVPPSTFTRMAQGLKPDVDAFATSCSGWDVAGALSGSGGQAVQS